MIYKHGGRWSSFTQFLYKTVFYVGFIVHRNMEGVHFENFDFWGGIDSCNALMQHDLLRFRDRRLALNQLLK